MIGVFRSSRQKLSDVNHFSRPLRKRKFSSTGSKGHCLWFVIGGFRSVFWVSVFQGSLLVILLWPKPDVNIPNIFDRFHSWTSDFQISMRQKYWRFRLNFEIVKVRLSAARGSEDTRVWYCTRRSHDRHSPRFACLLALFTLARIARLLPICVKTSRFYYSIWATPK